MPKFRHLPVLSLEDTTHNFEQLESEGVGSNGSGRPGLPGPAGKEGKEGKEGPGSAFAKKTVIAYNKTSQEFAAKTEAKVNIDTIVRDESSLFDTANHWYLVPTTGFYQVDAAVHAQPGGGKGNSGSDIIVAVNTVTKFKGNFNLANIGLELEGIFSMVASGVVFCTAGDHIELRYFLEAGGKTVETTEGSTYLHIFPIGGEGAKGEKGEKGEKGLTGALTLLEVEEKLKTLKEPNVVTKKIEATELESSIQLISTGLLRLGTKQFNPPNEAVVALLKAPKCTYVQLNPPKSQSIEKMDVGGTSNAGTIVFITNATAQSEKKTVTLIHNTAEEPPLKTFVFSTERNIVIEPVQTIGLILDTEQHWHDFAIGFGIAPTPKPSAVENTVVTGANTNVRKMVAAITGNEVNTKFKVEHGLNTRALVVSAQTSETELPGKFTQIQEYVPINANEVEVIFTTAPKKGQVFFITVTG